MTDFVAFAINSNWIWTDGSDWLTYYISTSNQAFAYKSATDTGRNIADTVPANEHVPDLLGLLHVQRLIPVETSFVSESTKTFYKMFLQWVK